ncbi:hypothetical protein P152DRAFT_395037 [Eremomyces bilateralis CBS 781.70]|uniref:Alpha/beta-hydrolase n=1 Tax=Eremomyces bilateralis CBS 781.70 TaxID=1392243 RepID=A0A6G1G5H3_9PEZI|nr:uncharacterized protein P152DRAFT_395037 [Eremomyces bilateralis CBS 781.70]KAF1813252.1 hypothetical protein P152DRAFT_395037 [Eremomyces bilateralis CBS 781.70]
MQSVTLLLSLLAVATEAAPQFGGLGGGSGGSSGGGLGGLLGGGGGGGLGGLLGNLLGGLLGGSGGFASLGEPSTGGSGPYPANFSTDPGLPKHTIYLPNEIPADLKLPVLVWGNGGCMADGTGFQGALTEWASHGFLVIANGSPGGSGQTTSDMLLQSIEFVTQNAGNGKYANIDASRIAAAGQSCGGLEAYDVAPDPRVSAIGIFNSGEFTDSASQQTIAQLQQPVFYFLGGPDDIAYENGERDFQNLPSNIPSWKGNLPVGHMSTFMDKDAGKVGVAGGNWLKWLLKGDQEAAQWFTSGSAQQAGWDVEEKNLQSIQVTPI